MVVCVGIPVTVSDVEVSCHDNCITDVSDVVAQDVNRCLIIVRVDVDDELYVLSIVKVDNIDIAMIYEIFSDRKSHS